MTQFKLTAQQVIDKFVKKRQDRQKIISHNTSNTLLIIVVVNVLFFVWLLF